MEHTFLLKEGLWVASGNYLDEENRIIPAEGETRISHLKDRWLNEGKLILLGDNPMEFRNTYEIDPLREGEDSTDWRSLNSSLGPLHGKLVVVEDSVLSAFRSEDALYFGAESMLQIDDRTYRASGVLYRGDKKISTWSVELKKVE